MHHRPDRIRRLEVMEVPPGQRRRPGRIADRYVDEEIRKGDTALYEEFLGLPHRRRVRCLREARPQHLVLVVRYDIYDVRLGRRHPEHREESHPLRYLLQELQKLREFSLALYVVIHLWSTGDPGVSRLQLHVKD